MNNDLNSFTRGHRTMAVIVAIIMVLLGIGIFIAPLFAVELIIWFFIAGLIIYGAFNIIVYVKSNVKNGWSLASGIMSTILGFLLMFSGPLAQADTFAFMLGFLTLTTGINQMTAASTMKSQGGNGTGWLTAAGVINIILALFFIFNPFVMLFAFELIAGVYLVVGGIALFATTLTGK